MRFLYCTMQRYFFSSRMWRRNLNTVTWPRSNSYLHTLSSLLISSSISFHFFAINKAFVTVKYTHTKDSTLMWGWENSLELYKRLRIYSSRFKILVNPHICAQSCLLHYLRPHTLLLSHSIFSLESILYTYQ